LSNLFLLLVSLLFYFWGENLLIWIIIASTLVDYFCGLMISGRSWRAKIVRLDPNRRPTWNQRLGLVVSITSNLSFLGFFKYFNFGVENMVSTMVFLGLDEPSWLEVASITLPLGISFYTFQSMSYTIDVYRGRIRATRNLIDFACYVTMFPQLVAGPIVRYRDVADQLVSRTISRSLFASGVSRFVIGLAKKVLIANTVATTADKIFALPIEHLTFSLAWLGIIAYSLQIYFDFSGYSDMAIGLGRMFGFNYLENFNYPYIASSIKDFWRRWHISLSTWFRDYLYIPLGGSRRSHLRTYSNLVTVFFLCGLWHGASWSFVIWGLFHGAFLVAERVGLERQIARLPAACRHVYTLLLVMVGWVFFRSESLGRAIGYLGAMVKGKYGEVAYHTVSEYLQPDVAVAIIIGIVGSMPVLAVTGRFCDRLRGRNLLGAAPALDALKLVAMSILMVLSAMRLASGSYNPFIYFRF
jgi:alginate O-acetyltransferase complex protein AlgI